MKPSIEDTQKQCKKPRQKPNELTIFKKQAERRVCVHNEWREQEKNSTETQGKAGENIAMEVKRMRVFRRKSALSIAAEITSNIKDKKGL